MAETILDLLPIRKLIIHHQVEVGYNTVSWVDYVIEFATSDHRLIFFQESYRAWQPFSSILLQLKRELIDRNE